KFLTAEDLPAHVDQENAAFRTVLLDAATGEAVVPNGSLGHRFGAEGEGRWNLDLDGVDPLLRLTGPDVEQVTVELPRFGDVDGVPDSTTATVPARRVDGHLVTTVFELMLAQFADFTPQWQEPLTGVPAEAAARVGRE